MQLVVTWLEAVFDNGDLMTVWHLVDKPLRLALVQSWILMEEDRPDIAWEDRDELASALASPQPSHRVWSEFAHWRTARWKNVLPTFMIDATRRGFVSIPALIGVDLEAVLVADTTTGGGRRIEAEEAVEVQRFLCGIHRMAHDSPGSVACCPYRDGRRRKLTACRNDGRGE